MKPRNAEILRAAEDLAVAYENYLDLMNSDTKPDITALMHRLGEMASTTANYRALVERKEPYPEKTRAPKLYVP